jgi:hypothetical protein
MTPKQVEWIVTFYNVKTMAIRTCLVADSESLYEHENELEDDELMFVNNVKDPTDY